MILQSPQLDVRQSYDQWSWGPGAGSEEQLVGAHPGSDGVREEDISPSKAVESGEGWRKEVSSWRPSRF